MSTKEKNRLRYSLSWAVIALAAGTVVWSLPLPLEEVHVRVLAIVVAVATLWLSEAVPLFVTSLAVPILLTVFRVSEPSAALAPFFDPLIALFLGSFVLAAALSKCQLHTLLASRLLRVARQRSHMVLLVLMLAAAFTGLWLSNTATVSLLLPVVLSIIETNHLASRAPRLAKSLLLGIAIAAAIGGMATIVGTPPNALAAGFLKDAGFEVSFVSWIVFGLPIAVILLPIVWGLLRLVFVPEVRTLKKVSTQKVYGLSRVQVTTLVVAALVIFGWLTEPFHGVAPAIVSLLGVVIIFALKLLSQRDVAKLPWTTLLLFGGGLSLGKAVIATGLAERLGQIWADSVVGLPLAGILALGMIGAVLITSFASNTASAAVVIPIAIGVASAVNINPVLLTVGITLALSLDFMTPVGTPPAAIVYGTGLLRTRDFLRAGSLITFAGLLVIFSVVMLVF
jgi:sodium-dependent dicarboxylate transporter 2/3/5